MRTARPRRARERETTLCYHVLEFETTSRSTISPISPIVPAEVSPCDPPSSSPSTRAPPVPGRSCTTPRRSPSLGSAQQEIEQHYPQDGWVEHEPEDIWYSVARTVREALANVRAATAKDVAAIGITNQRETVVVWDRATGRPVHRAIVWQDRRTTDFCREHAADQPWLTAKTGLVLDPYFSGTKLRWLLEQDAGPADARREQGELACGTIDSFLIWRLTGGASHVTDATNASRTLLFNIHAHAVGRRAAELLRRAAVDAAGGEAERGGVRRHEGARLPAGRHPDPRASPATSRRRCSARAASARARGSAPTAPARSSCCTPATPRWRRSTSCSPPWRR